MKTRLFFTYLLILVICSCQTGTAIQPEFVDITKVNKAIILDIRYATSDNFLGKAVYPAPRCFLRPAAAVKLDSVQKELQTRGLGLKIFDGYRPHSITKLMWQILPDDRYVANPVNGSRHNRGAAVDLTLVDIQGNELNMPTPFDDFSEKAGHDYMDLPEDVQKNRAMLKQIMEKYGFTAIKTEWWHYDISNYQDYPVTDISFAEIDAQSKQNERGKDE